MARLERTNRVLICAVLLTTIGCAAALWTSISRQGPQGRDLELDSLVVKRLHAGQIDVDDREGPSRALTRLEPGVAQFVSGGEEHLQTTVTAGGVSVRSRAFTLTLGQSAGGEDGGLLLQRGCRSTSGLYALPKLLELGTDANGTRLRLFDDQERLRCVLGAQETDGPDGRVVMQPESTLMLRAADGKVELLQAPK